MAATTVPPVLASDAQVGEDGPSSNVSTIKEKNVEKSDVRVVEEAQAEANNANDDFPDGGLRAWLIVVGVRSHFLMSSPHVQAPTTSLVLDHSLGHV